MKTIVARGILIGGFMGAVCGFLLGGGPDILYHFLPNLRIHGATLYPWPIGLVTAGVPVSLFCILPGAAIGYLIGLGLHSAQSHRNRELLQQTEADTEIWPPAPKV